VVYDRKILISGLILYKKLFNLFSETIEQQVDEYGLANLKRHALAG